MGTHLTAMGAINAGKGNKMAAKGATGAAMAREAMAKTAFDDASAAINSGGLAGIQTMETALAGQEKQLARNEQLIQSMDPAIVEASQQALRLLRGESSSTLAPMQKQRDIQRQKLVSSLREQLGPGAETSTAGMQALSRFDSESGNLFASGQQQALSNLGGLAGQFTQSRNSFGADVDRFANLGMNRANIGFQQGQSLMQAYAPRIDAAGGQFAGQVIQGQGMQTMGNSLMAAGAQQSGAAIGAMGSMMGASDERLKENIKALGEENGHKVYEFNYKGGTQKYIGVMAQEVSEKNPEAVILHGIGFLIVDYSKIGVEFRKVA